MRPLLMMGTAVMAMGVGFGLALGPGCDSGNSGGSCACSADLPCAPGFHCNGCACLPDCGDATPCPQATPNCGPDGLCFGACEGSSACVNPSFPNCDPATGLCLGPCSVPADCPPAAWQCDPETGLCFVPDCEADAACDPPTTVCEGFTCVPGCGAHTDCDAADRCDLLDPGHLYHCEPRDCLADTDCAPPTTRCDTDGLAQTDGGGYCLDGCADIYDCPAGFECLDATGICEPRDYGDIGAPCAGGCESGFCLTDQGNRCTAFCCRQVDCPAGWGCRSATDGAGGPPVDVCVPLPSEQGDGRPGDPCALAADCRSGQCVSQRCAESCCTHEDCETADRCIASSGQGRCVVAPTTGADPLGTLGCISHGSPGDCLSNLCFTYLLSDTACVTDVDCPESRPHCTDYYADGITDCVKDLCTDLCCGTEDCPDVAGDRYFCARTVYADYPLDVCLLHPGAGTAADGAVCASGSDCRSGFCSPTASVCRQRCCTDADCSDPLRPRCRLEDLSVYGSVRPVNVCLQ